MAQPVDIFSEALKTKAGEAQPATLFGVDFEVMRDHTGDQVHDYMQIFSESNSDATLSENILAQLKALTDLTGKKLERVHKELLKLSLWEASAVMIKLGQIAGLRDEDGAFSFGVLR